MATHGTTAAGSKMEKYTWLFELWYASPTYLFVQPNAFSAKQQANNSNPAFSHFIYLF